MCRKILVLSLLSTIALFAGVSDARTAELAELSDVLKNRSIGYVVTSKDWAYYLKPNNGQCPHGLNNMGVREQFKSLYPDNGTKRTYEDTVLKYERSVYFPHEGKDEFPFYEAQSDISYGLNLDGAVGRNDYTSPDGEKGVDNQLYRATGCVAFFSIASLKNDYMQRFAFDRVVIELTDIDSLVNDDDVTLTTYRGLDPLQRDASGSGFLPSTQRIDMKWGKELIQRFHGKIKDGVLLTEPADVSFGSARSFGDVTYDSFRGLRWKLNLTPSSAEGIIAGYADVEDYYRTMIQSMSTHIQSYGQLSSPALYRVLHRLADGYPDPKTGKNTAISAAMRVRLSQAFIMRPGEAPAASKVANAK